MFVTSYFVLLSIVLTMLIQIAMMLYCINWVGLELGTIVLIIFKGDGLHLAPTSREKNIGRCKQICFLMKMLRRSSGSLVQEKQTRKRGFSMSNIKEREKFDEYEMLDDYDFSDGVRGRFYKPKKIPTTLRLDNDIILYFKKLASEQKVPYQTLINALLRKELQSIQ